jgi:hypothetical protein
MCRVTRAISGCQNPNACYSKARDLLNALEEKWDPREPQPEDHEEYHAPEAEADQETVDFDPGITTHGTIADTFRIFTRGAYNLHDVAPDTRHADNGAEGIVVYTDGSATNNGSEDVQGRAGIYFGEGDPRNLALRVPNGLGPSNNVGEMVAIKQAVEMCLLDTPLVIHSDARFPCLDRRPNEEP